MRKTARVSAVSVLLIAMVAAIWSSHVTMAASPECIRCNTIAARRFLESPPVLSCAATVPQSDERRFLKRVHRCGHRFGCLESTAHDDAMLAAMRQAAGAVKGAICDEKSPPSMHPPGWGDPIDPHDVREPVGLVDPAVDPTTAPTFADVATFCAAHEDYGTPPPLLALPDSQSLPDWCDERQAYAQMAATCGDARVLFVAAGGALTGADGSVARPFSTIGAALAACGAGFCHVLIGPGSYAESLALPRCAVIEGGVQVAGGSAARGGERPRIEGSITAFGTAIVARVDVRAEYGALDSNGDLLVSETVLRGGYEGGSSAWTATGPRICRSTIAGGYSGFDIAWHSTRLWIAGSAISACYEGAALSWGSRGLKVIDSMVYGHYEAVGTSWGSTDVEVHGSRLGASYAAVDIHVAPDENGVFPATFDAIITDNRVASGTLPQSDAALDIVVANNVRE